MKYLGFAAKLFWLAVCSIGNLYQIVEISNQFFKYEIVSAVTVNFPDTFIAPAISVCLNEIELLDIDKFEKINPNIKEQFNFTALTNDQIRKKLKTIEFGDKIMNQTKMFYGLSIKQRSRVSSGSDAVFSICGLTNPFNGIVSMPTTCAKLFDIVPYKFIYSKCFQLNYKSDEYSMDLLGSYRAETIIGLIGYLKFSNRTLSSISEINIAFNRNRKYARVGYMRSLTLTDTESIASLAYEEYSNRLLPLPYVTGCRSYARVGDVIDRGTCYETCLKNMTTEKFNILLPGTFVFDDIITNPDIRHSTVGELLMNETLVELKTGCSKECDKQCNSPTCFDTFYVPILKSTVKDTDSSIGVYVMQSPKITTICDAKLSIVSYLTNIFSTFGFWIGLSVFSVADILDKLINQFYKSTNQNTIGERMEVGRAHNVTSTPNLRSINLLRIESTIARNQSERRLRTMFRLELLKLESRMRSELRK